MAPEKIEKNVVVGISYRLTVADGTEVDSTGDSAPLEYLHGHENIIPGLEKALAGRQVGDELDVEFEPQEAYGDREEDRVIEVTREQLGFDPEVGTVVRAQLPDGREQHLMIATVEGEKVTLDGNHPLAGEKLRFEVSVASLREASSDEIANGYIGSVE